MQVNPRDHQRSRLLRVAASSNDALNRTRHKTAHRLARTLGVTNTPACRPSGILPYLVLVQGAAMPDVKALEEAVKALPPQDLAAFRRWFADFDLAAWDRQLEVDADSGKLDALLAEADEDYKAGSPREL